MRSVWRTLLGIGFLGAWAARAWAVDLTAGPMIGHVSDKSVRVWVEFPVAGEVKMSAFEVQHDREVMSVSEGIEGPLPFVADLPLSGLSPNQTYRVEIEFDGKPVALRQKLFVTTAPAPGAEAPFNLAFGSNMNPQGRGTAPIFKAITDLKPRMFFFLGNSGALPEKLEDLPQESRLAYRFIAQMHSRVRREPDLQDLFAGTPCYGLFNDRDFGTPGSDKSFVFSQESIVAFERFWPNPDWGLPHDPGCFTRFSYGDADFFFVDVRSFRDPANKTMLGDAQLEWLKKALRESRANFKVIASAENLLPDGDGGTQGWSRFPEEQKSFMNWLAANQISGLLFICGDRPTGALTHLVGKSEHGNAAGSPTSPLPYPLFNLGTSTLTLYPHETAASQPAATSGWTGDNFGTLDFGGEGEHRFVTLRLHDVTGKVRQEQMVFAVQLR